MQLAVMETAHSSAKIIDYFGNKDRSVFRSSINVQVPSQSNLLILGHSVSANVHQYDSRLLNAGSNQGLTLDELVQRIQAQSSLPVEAQQIREALHAVSDDVIQEGSKYRHKNAIEVQ